MCEKIILQAEPFEAVGKKKEKRKLYRANESQHSWWMTTLEALFYVVQKHLPHQWTEQFKSTAVHICDASKRCSVQLCAVHNNKVIISCLL